MEKLRVPEPEQIKAASVNTGQGAGEAGLYMGYEPEEEELDSEEEGIMQIDLEDYYDLLMEQQEQM